MTRGRWPHRSDIGCGLLAFSLAVAAISAGPAIARDYGVVGQTFPVVEPDLLATIETRLARLRATGGIDRANALFARRAETRVRRPAPVAGLSPTRTPRGWNWDPSITIDHDVRDQQGRLIAARGQRINPLDFIAVRQDLVFIAGDSDAELAWATARFGATTAKIILVSGAPLEAMTARHRRFYFDQDGRLTARFGIAHTPAVVSQAGRVMRVSELVIGRGPR